MKYRIAVECKYTILSDVKFDSQQLNMLYSMIKTGYNTYDYLMSTQADDEWTHAQDENGETDREEWAKQEDEFYRDHGNAAHYFSMPRREKDAWLVHFTDSDPYQILKDGFKGRDTYGIGLTTMFKREANPGDLAFGYPAEDVKEFFKYGQNALIVQVKEALIAHHYGDEEIQAVFDVNEVEDMYPVEGDGKDLIVYDKEGNEVHRCSSRRGCVMDLVHAILEQE